jgi:hypothetical protein
MAVPITIVGILYAHPTATITKGGQCIVIAMLFAHFTTFAMTWGILMRIYVSEAQPVQTRASVSSLG